MDFGQALAAIKEGKRVAREGWNGKGMCLYLNDGSVAKKPRVGETIGGVPAELFAHGDRGTTTRMPSICMRTADGSIVVGWLASQTDMLAVDWSILNGGRG